MKNIKIIIMLIMTIILPLSAQTWNHVLADYSIVDIEKYDGGYWLATESNGALRYSNESDQWFRYNKANGIMPQNDDINDMKIMDGKVWFATNYGMYTCSLNGGNWKHRLLPGGYFENWVRAFDENSDTIFIAAFTGLFTYSKQTNTFSAHDVALPDNYQTSYTNSMFATDSLVWIGTDDGVIRYNTSLPIENMSSRTYFDKSNAFNTNSELVMCKSILATDDGVWVGLDEYTPSTNPDYCLGGLFFFDGTDWMKYDQSTGLPADGIHFIQEHDDKIYAGLFHFVDGVNFNGAGMLVLNKSDSTWEVKDSTNWGNVSNSIRSFYCNENDTIVGTAKGLYTNLNSLPDLKPYNSPSWYSLINIGNGEIEIRINPVYLADSYQLYLSNDGVLFEDTLSILSENDTISNLNDGFYFIKVAAKNQFGVGPISKELLCVSVGEEKNDILLIQGYDRKEISNTYDYCKYHVAAMVKEDLGVDCISDEALDMTGIELNDYSMVDWICGRDRKIITEQTKPKIKDYLESGGNLFISAEQLIENVSGNVINEQFYAEYFKALRKKPDARTYGIITLENGIFNGIGDFSIDDGSLGTYHCSQPDGFQILGGAVPLLLYAGKDSASTGSAALMYDGKFGSSEQTAKLVYMGIPYECIYPDSLREALMLCVLDHFEFDVNKTSINKFIKPVSFELMQNYPNPFNPNTVISYQLLAHSPVELSVYDINGRFVKTLVNEICTSGNHSVNFNAGDLPSGVYVCRLKVGSKIRTMKMLLMK